MVADAQPLPERQVGTLHSRLSNEVKRFIVVSLAQFESPTDVQAQVKETFGIEVTLPRLQVYDCTTATGQPAA
jgi:hypothetical protein